jgi:hypothetical protein
MSKALEEARKYIESGQDPQSQERLTWKYEILRMIEDEQNQPEITEEMLTEAKEARSE